MPDARHATRRTPVSIPHAPALTFAAFLIVGAVLTAFAVSPAQQLSPRFNHVMLYVSDLDASIDFYTRAFGVQVSNRVDSLTVIAPDGREAHNQVRMAMLRFADQEFVLELSEQPTPGGGGTALFQHLGVDVIDIESAAERVQAAGASEFSGIRTVRAHGLGVARNAFFRGPDGELLELMQMVEGVF